MSSLSDTINRLEQKSDADFQFGVHVYKIIGRQSHVQICIPESSSEIVEFNVGLIKILAYPIENIFIVYRIDWKRKKCIFYQNKTSDVTAIMRSTGNH